MNIELIYEIYQQYPSIQTDTRKLKEGDIYVALKGPNFNGNEFALRALDAGAVYAIVDEMPNESELIAAELSEPGIKERLLLVDDALTTLQQLAKHHRQQLDIPFIAITGSNGKTTSKELIYAVLSSHFKTYTTQGNLNNHIGVPLTILSVKPDAQMAVIEMGANHQKEIESYCTYTLPSHGIITNCGKAHLEGFGGVEGVRKGKGELYQFLREHKGTAFVYADYDYLQPMSAGIENIIYYGISKGLVQGQIEAAEPFLAVRITAGLHATLIKSQLVGDYNLPNILCAATIGKHFGVPDQKIISALEGYAPSNSRSQLMEVGTNQIILDAYNANPSSMKVAIENFAKLKADRKIVLLGGMMELGEDSIEEHQALVELLVALGFKEVVLVGGDFAYAHASKAQIQTTPFTYLNNAAEAREWLKQLNPQNACILVKGSRSMKMEQVLDA
ncbi:MAG TPA: UDP-N-acetylmuramoyl-tripeptide--D-alanyl-D-alanine ligase [Sediminibacterium sp.]|uniref:UDP-N-acetylmuramoyl-tripeptide--D-alanyl-D- alanine ligase n=1 Tax=Sediminibacterium sp. TaxID=1917865 RepID=UPI0008CA85A2|nr:UDP-N-acetylmuramoyl-tripeptide--D-alanyl-D-alanine ligase [Sediminibacterium sp.]OHC84514.1 MAG: UDP-N-acetylmuramoylalanyl-D-glutamate--2,6-diaminopimelate ligase [Sphingobacteriia bacterium RIFOXYC2_FULL_35_18]OHC89027.1 MAG: UDP-N-acetylmuramoylalanyl-D-glutamate--2,6-diaminopimelate ligase [Sphingobacteriia bacterium RIFOXYD2_FULL_35_12]HLD53108.1 UDP-N-acetylmuramoyl-tripeptide--D-alanyl-D-alanine ligase [Sediminibacterium sp.]